MKVRIPISSGLQAVVTDAMPCGCAGSPSRHQGGLRKSAVLRALILLCLVAPCRRHRHDHLGVMLEVVVLPLHDQNFASFDPGAVHRAL